MIQKIPQRMAWIIAKYGFSAIPTYENSFYGRGWYFSTSLDYASLCTPSVQGEDYVYLLSLVAPGNSYPVIETPVIGFTDSVQGYPCRPGYQSHYAMVQSTPEGLGSPTTSSDSSVGELMISDPSQALPFFIFKLEGETIAPTSISPQSRSEWNLRLDHTWNSMTFF